MRTVLIGVFAILIVCPVCSQDTLSKYLSKLPSNSLNKLENRLDGLEQDLQSKSERLLSGIQKQERKLYRKLYGKDSTLANRLFNSSKGQFNQLSQQVSSGELLNKSKQYIPYLDTIKTALSFLSTNFESIKIPGNQLANAQNAITNLDQQIQSAISIRSFLKERREMLKAELEKFGLLKELKGYNKKLYYYSQELQEYKNILNEPEKLERQLISVLHKIPAFKKFWQEHSELAALFPVPDNYGTMEALAGLQTRAMVQSGIQQQIQASGPNAEAMMQQNLQAAHQKVREWKEKINKLGGMTSDADIPDFKPNSQRTKKFLSRLEYGLNIQNTRANAFLPTTTDFGLSLGFKINDDASAGIGASYKMGWGKDIRNMTITHEGAGLRSYFDWKIKGNLYASGGYEQNYRQCFDDIRILNSPDYWQQSGLIGISKKYGIGKKFRGDFKVLFDFLYRSHSPATQPILFRFGYGL